jgi:superfamily II DNA or RNA helicase
VLSRHSLLLGDDVGLGKTYAAIALALQAETLPMAVVVEAHLQRQWADKIAAFCNLECHCVAKTTPYELPNAPIVIFRYSNIAGWVTEFAKGRFKSVVYDEIQNLRTGSSTNKGVAAQILSKNSVYQLGLSATPIFNLGAEIYSVVAFLPGKDVQHPLGTRGEFANEWLASGSDRIADPDALGMHLRERHVFMRRTKGDVGQEMDNVTAIYSEVPYDEGEEKRVEDVARTLAIRALTGSFVERGSAARELNMLMRHTTGVAKARGVAQFVRMILETGEKVLLAGWHRDFWKVVETELAEFKPCFYTGTESPAQKTKSVKAFTDGDSQVMFISLRSGSGLDGIQKVCSTAVLGEFDWSPQVHKQVVGRLDREGQTRPVTAFFLSVNCGSDPAIVELLGLKASQIRGVIDPNQPFRPVEVDDSKLRHLARDYLRRHGIALPKDAAADEDPPPAANDAAGDAPPSDPAAVEDAEWSVEEARIRASAAR